MIKMRRKMNSNWFFGVALFLSFFLMWGCSKNVAPPEVETAPEVAEIPPPVVEDTAPEPGPEQGVQEEGFGIDAQQEAPVVEETFEEPEPVQEEIVEMTPEPVQEEIVEMTPEPQPEPMVEPEPEPQQEEVVEMTPEPQPEPQEEFAPEPEPVQEARIIPDFKEEKQLQDIHFEYDRDQLNSQNKEILRSNAQWLKNNPNVRVEIQGHADERGTNNYNLGLGERRALQTKKYLISQGVDESRLYTISYGEEKPFCFESNENCWWENRRAHFTVAE